MDRVLFVCIHNSSRSQMAEAFLRELAGDRFEVRSAGLEPGELNPLVVEVMQEVGIDISNAKTKAVFDLFKSGELFRYVITVCDQRAAEACPVFPGNCERIHWSFADPKSFEGTHEERLALTRKVRDEIKAKLEEFCVQSAGLEALAI